MTFLEPFWLFFALFPILLVGVAAVLRTRQPESWRLFVSQRLAPRLVRREKSYPWWLSFCLVALAMILLFVALAKPVSGQETVNQRAEGRTVFLAVDLSRSMLVSDTSPDRLTAAKTAALEIIDQFPNDRIGVISFAGKAWLEAPLTVDHQALRETVLAMNEKNVPLGGSSQTAPLELATAEARENGLQESILVLLSDGEFHNRFSVSEIEEATREGIRIFTLGFGTEEGGFVPDSRQVSGRFLDAGGRPVRSTLQEEPLRRLASLGQGAYFRGNDYRFISELSRTLSEMSFATQSDRTFVLYRHIYQWFLGLGLLCLVSALLVSAFWRAPMTPVASAAILTFCFVIGSSFNGQAATSSVKDVRELLERQQYDEAAQKLREITLHRNGKEGEKERKLYFSLGHAQYRQKNFPEAIEAYSQSLLSDEPALQEEAHYNLGNTLYFNGASRLERIAEVQKPEDQLRLRAGVMNEWQGALDHYHGAVHLNKDHLRARENYEMVKEKLEELQREQEQQRQQMEQLQSEGEPQRGQGNGEGEGRSDENQTSEELERSREEERREGEGSEEQSPPEPQNGDEGEEEAAEGSEELEDQLGEEEDSGMPSPSTQEARRILEENADFEKGNLRTGRRIFEREPQKDW